jgi:hypothetical protein
LISGFEPNQICNDLVKFPVPVQIETCSSVLQLDMRPRSGWDFQSYGHGKDSSRISTKFVYERKEETGGVLAMSQLPISFVIGAATQRICVILTA